MKHTDSGAGNFVAKLEATKLMREIDGAIKAAMVAVGNIAAEELRKKPEERNQETKDALEQAKYALRLSIFMVCSKYTELEYYAKSVSGFEAFIKAGDNRHKLPSGLRFTTPKLGDKGPTQFFDDKLGTSFAQAIGLSREQANKIADEVQATIAPNLQALNQKTLEVYEDIDKAFDEIVGLMSKDKVRSQYSEELKSRKQLCHAVAAVIGVVAAAISGIVPLAPFITTGELVEAMKIFITPGHKLDSACLALTLIVLFTTMLFFLVTPNMAVKNHQISERLLVNEMLKMLDPAVLEKAQNQPTEHDMQKELIKAVIVEGEKLSKQIVKLKNLATELEANIDEYAATSRDNQRT